MLEQNRIEVIRSKIEQENMERHLQLKALSLE